MGKPVEGSPSAAVSIATATSGPTSSKILLEAHLDVQRIDRVLLNQISLDHAKVTSQSVDSLQVERLDIPRSPNLLDVSRH